VGKGSRRRAERAPGLYAMGWEMAYGKDKTEYPKCDPKSSLIKPVIYKTFGEIAETTDFRKFVKT